MDTVQSALQAVKGVKDAKVTLDPGEAVVTYDPSVCKVEDLIKAVDNAHGMAKYTAKVKEK